MNLPDKKHNTFTRSISKFKGLNRLPVPEDGELTEVMNLSFDFYPVMFPVNEHLLVDEAENTDIGGGIINANGTLAWVKNGTLYYDGTATGLTGLSTTEVKSMVEFWGKIFIFPDKKYYDIAAGTYGDIGTSNDPDDPSMCPDMDYVCVHNNRIWGVGGNTIYASRLGWALGAADSTVETIASTTITSGQWTETEDQIMLESDEYAASNKIIGGYTYVVTFDNTEYRCVAGVASNGKTGIGSMGLDFADYPFFITVYPDGGSYKGRTYIANGVPASHTFSAIEDGKHGWTSFIDATGYPDDAGSFVQDFASEGEFIGICSWDDRIVALKPRCHHEVMGSYPSTFSVTTVSKTGTTDNRSICEVDGRLYYASYGGMYSYAGGVEQNISRKAMIAPGAVCCGTDGTHLYVCDDAGNLFVYDAARGIWSQQSQGNFISMAFLDGVVYAMDYIGSVYALNSDTDNVSEWSFGFNDYNETVYNQNDIRKIVLKMKARKDTKIKIELLADKETDGRSFSREYIVKPYDLKEISFPLNRAAEHDIRVSGDNYVWIYGFKLTGKDGGENIV